MYGFLYIHIPFCNHKCIYCDFFSVPYDEAMVRSYIRALCTELTLKKQLLQNLKTVYIGGGTPSILPQESFQQLFSCLDKHYSLMNGTEITVEINPGTIENDTIRFLHSLGVNRISIGVQSFMHNELKIIGRVHTVEDSLKCISLVHKSGVENISLDLLYGIPGQTMKTWEQSLSHAIKFSPHHLSTYELTPEKNTPLYQLLHFMPRKSSVNHFVMPDEELILMMYNSAIDYLTEFGYEHYEISNFAYPAYRCIHNLNYWNRGDYIGAGAGVHSFIKGTRSMNVKDLHGYISQIEDGIIPETLVHTVTEPEAERERIFLGLRKTEGLSINKSEQVSAKLLEAGKEMIRNGFLEKTNGRLKLTRKGITVSNSIIIELLKNLGL